MIPVYFVGWHGRLDQLYAHHAGSCLALVFQLAHVVEDAAFVLRRAPGIKLKNGPFTSSYNSQLCPGINDQLVVGGLNYQIEHHLPKVSHIHYPAKCRYRKNVCMKHQIHYNEFKTMTAIASHFRMMRIWEKTD